MLIDDFLTVPFLLNLFIGFALYERAFPHLHTPVFIEALFTIAKTWEQSKCLSTEEWIKKMWYIYRHWNVSHKKNEMMPFAATWMDLEIIILCEVTKIKTNTI